MILSMDIERFGLDDHQVEEYHPSSSCSGLFSDKAPRIPFDLTSSTADIANESMQTQSFSSGTGNVGSLFLNNLDICRH